MKKIIPLFLMLLSFQTFAFDTFSMVPTDSDSYEKGAAIANLDEILDKAEMDATVSGRKVLESARLMINNEEIILGSCWDFIDAVYDRAGFTSNFRKTVFKSKLQGPYSEVSKFEGGDWLYFINHSYGDVEHSSVFVAWTDLDNKVALMISYAGGNQAKPARYKTYDLSSVYNIIRPK